MNVKSIICSILATLSIMVCFTSCGAAKSFDESTSNFAPQEDSFISEDINYYTDGSAAVEAPTEESSVDLKADNTSTVADNRKIIKTCELSVETKEFDTLIDNITKEVTALGGYIESADISGRSMDSHNTRSADLTVRIPANKDTGFLEFISENSVITRQYVTTDDITLSYVDTESRLSALKSEKQALENLLKEATLIEDIIALTDRLTNVIQEIESYESQLRTYDNLVEYCTISIYIDEVEFTTVTEEKSVWERIVSNLKKNFTGVWNGLQEVFVFCISIIPYLLPFAIIGIIVLLSVRRSIHRRQTKQLSDKANEETTSSDQ